MIYEVLSTSDKQIVSQSVKLHIASLSYRSFITDFGEKFLHIFYTGILDLNLGFIVVAREKSSLCGMALCCVDSSQIYVPFLKKWYIVFPMVLKRLMQKPKMVGKIFESFFYSKKEAANEKAELVVIAVSDLIRSKGIGSTLISKVNEEFQRRSIRAYKVTVHEEMTRSINFYLKNSFALLKTFMLYATRWHVYRYTIF